jgi:hypothetical protein
VRERKVGGTHLSAHGAVVLPAEPHGGRTTGCRCPYGLFRGRDLTTIIRFGIRKFF